MTESMAHAVAAGRKVTLHYTLALADGTVLDSTDGEFPARLRIGSGELVDFLEQRLVGLQPGDQRRFEIPAAETRSSMEEGALQRMPRGDFPADMELAPGQVLGFRLAGDEEIPAQVVAVTDQEVTVDFSHPLAGRDLVFDVEIIAVDP